MGGCVGGQGCGRDVGCVVNSAAIVHIDTISAVEPLIVAAVSVTDPRTCRLPIFPVLGVMFVLLSVINDQIITPVWVPRTVDTGVIMFPCRTISLEVYNVLPLVTAARSSIGFASLVGIAPSILVDCDTNPRILHGACTMANRHTVGGFVG